MKNIILIFCCLLVSSCSVRYGTRIPGFVPGYKDTRLGEFTYQVRIGQAWPKDYHDLDKFAMYRASDITKSRGFRYFIVTSASTEISDYSIKSPTTTNTHGTIYSNGNTATLNATSTTTGGTVTNISGGFYTLDFKILKDTEINKYSHVIDSKVVMEDLKYFIDERR